VHHQGISPEKAAQLRTMYSDAHQIFTTFGLDYRGHGLSDGNRGDSPNKERWIADLTESVEHIKCLGFQRVIIVGHSLGVAAAICIADAILEEIVEWMDSTY
jgi:alpha-beta hydrolase superfamily lysophospholipase